MLIHSLTVLTNRNIYCHRPVIKMEVDIGDLYLKPTNRIEGFNEKLLSLFPGLLKHCCSLGYEGGFVERLKGGTYAAHVTEHLALELQNILGYDVSFGKARIKEEPSIYSVVYEYGSEKCGLECGRAAVEIVSSLVSGKEINLASLLEELKRVAVETELGPSSKAIYQEALKLGIPVIRLGSGSIMQLGYGKYARLVEASLTDSPSCVAVDAAGDKHLTKQILKDNRIPVPCGDVAYTEDSALVLAGEIGYPVVVKPCDANQGKGVTLDIRGEEEVREAFREARKHSVGVIVEKYVEGKDYRLLVVGDRVVAAAERRPPCVTGDGLHSVKELVELANRDSLRGENHEKPLTKIRLDEMAKKVLARQGYTEESVPEKGQLVKLRENGNLSTGGTARDCTGEVHPFNADLAVKAAKAVGLDIAGVDITAEDISRPIGWPNGAVIELNACPGLRMHLFPSEGKPRNVARDIVEHLFPPGCPSRIPIVSVTGTNGKTTTVRLIRHTLAFTGRKVGMTSTSGIFIGSRCIQEGDNTGPTSARIVLSNREVEAAVLETARGGIVRRGLGYDMADVGVVVNISDDHLGLDGLNSIEDLAFVKSLVLEAVKPDGHSVINADDDTAGYLMERASGNIVLFSKRSNNPLLLKHMTGGGKAVYVKDGFICIHDRTEMHILRLSQVPITFNGMLECNVENSLSAAAALYALGVPLNIIRIGLKSFNPDVKTNPGRFNFFRMGDFDVMLDYGHNAAGYSAVLDFVKRYGARRLVGIIGVPGDRMDRSVKEIGEMSGRVFNRIYVKEDRELRGRKPGEIAGLLYNSVISAGLKENSVKIVLSELEALEEALLNALPGDLIVMLYEEFEPAVRLIAEYKNKVRNKRRREKMAGGL